MLSKLHANNVLLGIGGGETDEFAHELDTDVQL
jgi:hypothetical protein